MATFASVGPLPTERWRFYNPSPSILPYSGQEALRTAPIDQYTHSKAIN